MLGQGAGGVKEAVLVEVAGDAVVVAVELTVWVPGTVGLAGGEAGYIWQEVVSPRGAVMVRPTRWQGRRRMLQVSPV